MEFRQLYYTSCRTGLSGYAGYQFNAVTPGVSPEVMNEVEAVSSYEPPSTLGHSPSPEEIAGCPVNLCFVPGPEPIVANVAFTGTDYSGRFGNYFAHALVPSGGESWPGSPPIELWKAPLWSRETVSDPDLPPLPGPLQTGPLGRAAVDGFLDRTPGRSRLPALLAATELAVLDQERSVVILAADDEEVAYWIAALSYLLPPPLVTRMSFATYQFRPSYSRHHVIGTVPGAEIVADERAFAGFYLFDFTAGTCSEVEAGPLPQLLAGVGAVAAGPLWRRAADLAAGGELRLADWHPPVAAAALLDGEPGIGPVDLDAACTWLGGHAHRLDRDTVGRIGAAALAHDAASPAHMSGLADAADAAGLGELLALAEEGLVTAQLAQAAQGGAPRAVRLRSADARERARRDYARLLAEADATTVVRLLDLAVAHGVEPDPETLRDCGLRVIGPELLRRPGRTDLHDAVQRVPELRAGTLAHLDQVAATDAAPLYAVFDAGLDTAVPGPELARSPSLYEVAQIARGRREPEHRVEALLSVLAARGPYERLDNALLAALWPDAPTIGEALSLLERLPDAAAGEPVLVTWMEPLLRWRPPAEDLRRQRAYGDLCALVTRSPLVEALPADLRDRVRAVAWIGKVEEPLLRAGTRRNAEERYAAAKRLLDAYGTAETASAADYLGVRLGVLLPGLPYDALARLLARAPDAIIDAYLARLVQTLAGEPEDAVPAAAAAFATMRAVTGRSAPVAAAVHDTLVRSLPDWRRRALNEVEREVQHQSGRLAMVQEFKRWREEHCRPRRRWLPGLRSR